MSDTTIKNDTFMFDIFDYDKYDEYLKDIGYGVIFHDDLVITGEPKACELLPQTESDDCYYDINSTAIYDNNIQNNTNQVSPASDTTKQDPELMKQLVENSNMDENTKILHPLKKKRKLTPDSELIKHRRLCTGVTYHPKTKKFRARIKVDGRTTHLGYFDTEIEAALAYDRAAYELRGDNALFNFGTPPLSKIHHDNAGMSMKERCKKAACSVSSYSKEN